MGLLAPEAVVGVAVMVPDHQNADRVTINAVEELSRTRFFNHRWTQINTDTNHDPVRDPEFSICVHSCPSVVKTPLSGLA